MKKPICSTTNAKHEIMPAIEVEIIDVTAVDTGINSVVVGRPVAIVGTTEAVVAPTVLVQEQQT